MLFHRLLKIRTSLSKLKLLELCLLCPLLLKVAASFHDRIEIIAITYQLFTQHFDNGNKAIQYQT